MAAPDRTHYDVLGIARDADASAVRSAWKLHVQAWHPDRFSGEMREHAEAQTVCINGAYNTLRDASRRAAYDCRLAAEEQAARPTPQPRRTQRMQPAAHRHAATPVGTPMAYAEPLTTSQQASAAVGDALAIVRRHPRIVAAAATVWVLVFGGSLLMHVISGPTLPSASTATAAPASAIVASEDQVADLEELADRAREESAKADAELEAMMRADAAAARAEAIAAARAAAAAAKAQRGRKSAAPRDGAAPRAGAGRRIVRVMPSTATV